MKKPKTEMKTEPTEPGAAGAEELQAAPEDGIGDRIRSAREGRGFSQTGLATRTRVLDSKGKGVARTVIVGYEAGTFRPGAREIRLICQALSVSPNWLILGAEAAPTQASMETLRGNEWKTVIRLAMAISILKPHERAAFQSLVLSLAGRQLGDMKLSALLAAGSMVANASLPSLVTWIEVDQAELEHESLDALISRYATKGDGFTSNWGNKLVLDEDEGNVIGGEWLYPDPSGKVSE